MFPIHIGDRGDAVADVQRRLSAIGYAVGPSGVDGVFAEDTSNAVATFQVQRGLDETGVVDETTWRSLVEASVRLGDRLLYMRSPFFHGDDVRELQGRLNTLGFNCGAADGIFGRMTERAVRDFQTNYGLPADGIVGEATLGAMGKLRNILESKSATSLPRKRPKPFSSAAVFKQRSVRVAFGTPSPDDPAQGRCEDLAERLKNLLELLGARVQTVDLDTALYKKEVDVNQFDAVVIFDLAPNTARAGFAVEALGHGSIDLARRICDRLSSSVTEMINRGITVHHAAVPLATVIVRPGSVASDADMHLLADEAFTQRIAVAVFDGLHSYFRMSRHGA